MAITPQWKDELRARITLSSVILRTDKLTKAGREWKGCCPFHDEKTPSFYVNDQKQFYHCFGCGAHGDVISWMTLQRGLSFIDAIKELANEAGMEVPAPDPAAAKRAEKRAELVDVTAAAQDWFANNLHKPQGKEALAYLEARGLKPETLREFGFGFAPDSKQALRTALSQFDEEMLETSGMRVRGDDGAGYDRFRSRITLPIQDARGRVIAFGGRILESRARGSGGIAKYLNSPDTPLFDKGRTLYNLHRAAPASRQSGRVIVVEGYMDVVALAQAGFDDVVAPLGTALTEPQLEMLWRMVEVPILCFDGDSAGQRAAMRAVQRALPLLGPMRSLSIVRLPAGLDPDDLVNRDGAGAMEELVAQSESVLDILWSVERDAQPLATPESKAGLKARLMAHVDTIADQDVRALYRRELLDRFSAFAYPPRDRPANGRRQNGSGGFSRHPKTFIPRLSQEARNVLGAAMAGGQRDTLLRAIIAGFVRHPGEIAGHAESLTRLAQANPTIAPAIELLMDLSETLDSPGGTAISAQQGYPAPPVNSGYAFLQDGTSPGEAREELAEAVSLLAKKPALEAAMAATVARFDDDPEGSLAEQARLRQQLTTVDERLKAFGRRKAGKPVEQD